MSKKFSENDEDYQWDDSLEWDERYDEFDDSFDDVEDDMPVKKKNTASRKAADKSRRTAAATATAGNRKTYAKKSSASSKKKHSSQKKKRRRNLIIICVAEILLLAMVCMALVVMNRFNSMHVPDEGGGPSFRPGNDIEVNELDSQTLERLKGYTTYAVLGLDQRDQEDYSTGRSDVIVLVSVNNDTGEINMASVYRDTYLQIDASGRFDKINAAYQYGAAQQAIQALNTNLDLQIDHYVTVNWRAVAEIIDLMGGVEIEISEEVFYATEIHGGTWLNSYIEQTALELGYPVSYPAGPGFQTLNGLQAVALCRIRQGSLMDYGRAENQRQVVSQMFEKAKELVKKGSIATLIKIADTAIDYVQTDLTGADVAKLLPEIGSFYLDDSDGFPAQAFRGSANIGTLDCVVPKDLLSAVAELHRVLYNNDAYVPSDTVINISEEISRVSGLYAN